MELHSTQYGASKVIELNIKYCSSRSIVSSYGHRTVDNVIYRMKNNLISGDYWDQGLFSVSCSE